MRNGAGSSVCAEEPRDAIHLKSSMAGATGHLVGKKTAAPLDSERREPTEGMLFDRVWGP